MFAKLVAEILKLPKQTREYDIINQKWFPPFLAVLECANSFVTKCDKKTLYALFRKFEKALFKSVVNTNNYINYYKKLLKCDRNSTVRQFFTNCERYQEMWHKVITKCNNCYKVRRNNDTRF